MTARENQIGLYIADRWQVNEKLTLNLGVRYENYPLMSRANRGIELLDLTTFNVRLGGSSENLHSCSVDRASRAAVRRPPSRAIEQKVYRRARLRDAPASVIRAV